MAEKLYYMQDKDGVIYTTAYPQTLRECILLAQAEGKRLYREQCRMRLLAMIQPGQTVYTLVRHVSQSGMSRRISLFIVRNGAIACIDGYASHLVGNGLADKGGIKVGGCGMDMGFHLVYSLGYALWPNGTPEPHGNRNGMDNDGGYALKHEWL